MRRLLILTLPLVLSAVACDSDDGDGDDGGRNNASILALDGDAAAGRTAFTSGMCSSSACHGTDGNSGSAPRFDGLVRSRTDDQIIDAVLDGKGGMPPQDLSDQDMANVLTWLRDDFE